ncbi:hypothetical protein X566_14170 [Afipia sp. P52-10]|jgi:hypothetical protein|uniref:BA14K family protein n=1 Tax=Afipia sp. P52-10 TaxID=1429916 RepID=UPI0003DF2A07|nr:BA14K family protein [Afipia sp. P52-10]ETR78678.1 hypothetical protein X566_14170 [Afipia sp. P52-10]
MKLARACAVTLFAASTALALSMPAQSAPLTQDKALASAAATGVETVQWHGGHRHRGYYGPRYHHHHHHRGPSAGAVIGGLAAGAVIGGIIAGSQAQAAQNNAIAYCSQRFRSYDPASGTYLAKDGYRRPCP